VYGELVSVFEWVDVCTVGGAECRDFGEFGFVYCSLNLCLGDVVLCVGFVFLEVEFVVVKVILVEMWEKCCEV